jgi:threonine/homoserine/homoserine lactone efflux protein
MVPAANLLAFGLASIPLIVIPGQSVLFTIGRSLALGKVGGLVTVLGNSLGALVITVAIAIGLGTVLESSAVVFTVVKVLGAAYIMFLGVQAIRHRNRGAQPAATAPKGGGRTFWEGFLVGVSNVKTMIFFLAVFPLFVDRAAGAVPGQILTLGAVFIAIALVSDSTWALIAGSARDWFARSPRRIPVLAATGGVMMIGIGAAVLLVGHGPSVTR